MRCNSKKILVINTIGFRFEGISTSIINYLSHMEQTGIEIHVITPFNTSGKFVDKLNTFGIIHFLPDRKQSTIYYIFKLNKLLKNRFDIVHIHGNSSTMCLESFLSKLNGTRRIIVHNHSTCTEHPILNKLLNPFLISTSNLLLACSNEAGLFLYKHNNFYVLNNAIDLNRFKFCENYRDKIRSETNVTGKFVMGHVGYYSDNKNQIYLLNLLAELKKQGYTDIVLLLIGNYLDNELFNKTIESLNLEDNIITIKATEIVEQYYSAMDLFLFPSLKEGQGMVLLEAQANGLNCLASTGVPNSTNLSGDVEFIELSSNYIWLDNIILNYESKFDYTKRYCSSLENMKIMKSMGFDIIDNSSYLKRLYLNDL